MRHNAKENHFIAITGIETLLLGAYLIYVANVFIHHTGNWPPAHRRFMLLQHAQDPYLSIGLVAVGTFAIITAIFDLSRHYAKRIALTTMLSMWSMYLAAFVWRDWLTPAPISLDTLLIGCIVVRIFIELCIGNRT